jgi:ankyrin repeat protein
VGLEICPTIKSVASRASGSKRMTFDETRKLIKKGDIIRLRKELQDGLSPNRGNQYSWTLLMIAALEGNTSIGLLLIQSGAELDRRNKFHDTALSLAAHSGHASFVDLLLTSGASLECHPFGNTFDAWLNWACQYGRCSKTIRALFDKERKIRADRDHALDQLT